MDTPVGSVFLNVYTTDGFRTQQQFAKVEVLRAAAAHLNMLTREQYDVIVSCMATEHVQRVYRVKQEMDAHPATGHGFPAGVRAALDDLKSFEGLMADLRVEKPDPVALRAAVNEISGETVAIETRWEHTPPTFTMGGGHAVEGPLRRRQLSDGWGREFEEVLCERCMRPVRQEGKF